MCVRHALCAHVSCCARKFTQKHTHTSTTAAHHTRTQSSASPATQPFSAVVENEMQHVERNTNESSRVESNRTHTNTAASPTGDETRRKQTQKHRKILNTRTLWPTERPTVSSRAEGKSSDFSIVQDAIRTKASRLHQQQVRWCGRGEAVECGKCGDRATVRRVLLEKYLSAACDCDRLGRLLFLSLLLCFLLAIFFVFFCFVVVVFRSSFCFLSFRLRQPILFFSFFFFVFRVSALQNEENCQSISALSNQRAIRCRQSVRGPKACSSSTNESPFLRSSFAFVCCARIILNFEK